MMKHDRHTLSAVLINYNHAGFLPNALNAALNQTVPFDEVIIIDDASTDNSVNVIRERIQNTPARLVQNAQNKGVIETLNVGLAEATGDFIFFMSADDNYSLQCVEWYRQALEHYPDVAMLSGNVTICNSDTGKDRVFTLPFPQYIGRYARADLAALAKKRAITFYGGANLMRRDALLKANGHVAALKWHADWFLYLLLGCRYPFAVVPQEFIRMRQASDQYSHACYDWKKQKPVIEAFIRLLMQDYPDAYGFFRSGGLLPTYDIESLFLLLKDKSLRPYLTPLLAWRLLSYKPMRAVGRLMPEDVRIKLRKWLRV